MDSDDAAPLVGLLSLPFLFLIKGLVLSTLWSWFIVPLGVPAISIPMAIGIGIVAAYMTGIDDNGFNTDSMRDVLKGIVHPLVILFIGWIVLFFM